MPVLGANSEAEAALRTCALSVGFDDVFVLHLALMPLPSGYSCYRDSYQWCQLTDWNNCLREIGQRLMIAMAVHRLVSHMFFPLLLRCRQARAVREAVYC
jgi:hypothetical protein